MSASERELAAHNAALVLHASMVALDGCGALILGGSGSGKSALALTLMSMGAGLVADDRTHLRRVGDHLVGDAPVTIRGRIEARGVGILKAPAVGPCKLDLVVDLDQSETDRLPSWHNIRILGITNPLLHNPGMAHFPHAILHYLKFGRVA